MSGNSIHPLGTSSSCAALRGGWERLHKELIGRPCISGHFQRSRKCGSSFEGLLENMCTFSFATTTLSLHTALDIKWQRRRPLWCLSRRLSSVTNSGNRGGAWRYHVSGLPQLCSGEQLGEGGSAEPVYSAHTGQ